MKVDPKIMHPPIPINTPPPDFPNEARAAKEEGICLVSLMVDENGKPKSPEIIRCTDPIFAQNSLKAVNQWKFKPARMITDGKAVPVTVRVGVIFWLNFDPRPPSQVEPPVRVQYDFGSPSGISSLDPDGNGLYPLTKSMEPPIVVKFVSRGFGRAALAYSEGIGCHVLLTISVDGKASDAQATECDKAELEKPAVESLLNSKYKPAQLNGKEIAVRAMIHVMYDGFQNPRH
jgi:TonB family protein